MRNSLFNFFFQSAWMDAENNMKRSQKVCSTCFHLQRELNYRLKMLHNLCARVTVCARLWMCAARWGAGETGVRQGVPVVGFLPAALVFFPASPLGRSRLGRAAVAPHRIHAGGAQTSPRPIRKLRDAGQPNPHSPGLWHHRDDFWPPAGGALEQKRMPQIPNLYLWTCWNEFF